jgi:beta-lactamase superfamily II metal-dependent hydrolase
MAITITLAVRPRLQAAFPSAKRYAGEPQRMSIPMDQCVVGQHWEWDGVRFDVLSPATSAASRTTIDHAFCSSRVRVAACC